MWLRRARLQCKFCFVSKTVFLLQYNQGNKLYETQICLHGVIFLIKYSNFPTLIKHLLLMKTYSAILVQSNTSTVTFFFFLLILIRFLSWKISCRCLSLKGADVKDQVGSDAQFWFFLPVEQNLKSFAFTLRFIHCSLDQFLPHHIISVATVVAALCREKIEVISEHLHYTFSGWKSNRMCGRIQQTESVRLGPHEPSSLTQLDLTSAKPCMLVYTFKTYLLISS